MYHQGVVIVGAGPAGLTAGYELLKRGTRPMLFEMGSRVGGIARTEVYNGYRFDIGGHRFYTKVSEVEKVWHEVLGPEFLKRPRLSRIYYRGQFYNYPLNLTNTLSNLGLMESSLIVLSYLKWQLFPHSEEETFEQWVTNRFGQRLYKAFFKTYTEKVWGIPCNIIRADWAAQRIKGLSLTSAVTQALFNKSNVTSLIEEFHYPRLGPGMMWERMLEKITAGGGQIQLNTEVVTIKREGNRIKAIVVNGRGGLREIQCNHFISTMPASHLLFRLDPPPPEAVLHAARSLNYRDFLMVGLIVKQADIFPDNWIYIHHPDVKVGRIQNFKNWSADMVPDQSKTSLGMEYFCNKGDDIWQQSDEALVSLAMSELAELGLADAAMVEDGVVIRQPKAYPVYDHDYRQHVQTIRNYLVGLENLQTVGRNGMHRYNNQDHSMLTAMLAVKNLFGEQHDLWNVNTERSYYEEVQVKPRALQLGGRRAQGWAGYQ